MAIILIIAVSFFLTVQAEEKGEKIYGGYPIQISDAPYMVKISFQKNDTMFLDCGGTILSRRYVLTAGHCATDHAGEVYKPKLATNFILRVGSTEDDRKGKLYNVSSVFPHPKYRPESPYHDVAILRTTEEIKFNFNIMGGRSTVNKVQLADRYDEIKDRDHVTAAGWGHNPDDPYSNKLFRIDLKIVEAGYCASRWNESPQAFRKHQVCAIGRDNRDVCAGDSGGPLMHGSTNKQIGIVSFGAACKNNPKHLPGVYTKIQDNLDFIYTVTRRS